MADGPLTGRVAAITGASSGIGEATATALSRAGATVALGARRRDRLDALADKLEGPASVHEVDLADEGATRAFVEAAQAEHDGLHILVNNAGVMLLGPVAGADVSDWRRMLDVNLWGLLVCTHAALPLIEASGGGDIVNVSSVAGRVARAGAGVYNLTKFGIGAFSEALRQECVPHGIRVTLVEPGATTTELQGHNREPVRQMMAERFEGVTPLEAADIARAIVYVLGQPDGVAVNELLVRPATQVN